MKQKLMDWVVTDDKPPRRTSPGLEAHVWISGGLRRCHGQGAKVAVEGLREGLEDG